MAKSIDRIGQKFNRLIIVSYAKRKSGYERKMTICLCDCGKSLTVDESSIISGNTKSCGCLKTEVNKKRGDGRNKTALYRVYYSMIGRCNNKNDKNYKNYGARGIKVCDEWLNSFDVFRDWAIKNGYIKGRSIDRFPDNNGNYHPANCRFVSMKINSNNKRNTIMLTYNGETKPLTQWAEITGIKESTLRNRSQELKLPVHEVLSTKKLYRGFVNRIQK